MSIVENGRSDCQILTPGRFYPVEELAARSLQEGILRMTGVRLPVRWAHQRVAGRTAVLVGSADPGGEADLWQKDSFEVLPRRPDLLLRGTPRRVTHYAVSAFLESLGARFLGPDDVIYPRLDRVRPPDAAVRSTAGFSYRLTVGT